MLRKINKNIVKFFREYEALMKNNIFIRLILAGIVSSFGSKISYFALLRKVYIISGGKVTDLGFLAIVEIIPTVFLGVFAGIIIDRFSRKWIMIFSDICSGLAVISIIFIDELKYIYLIALIKSAVNAFRIPAQSAFEPNLVEKEDIPLLNSFKASTNSLIQIIGSATGAAVVGFVGVRNAFIIDGFTFWISALILVTIVFREIHIEGNKNIVKKTEQIKEFLNGISIIWSNNKIKLMISIELFLTFAMAMQGTLIYFFIRETLKMGDRAEFAWGILLSALGVGTIVGSFILGVKVKRYHNPFKLFLNVLLFDAVGFSLFVLNTYFPLSVVLFTFLGVIGAAHTIIFNSVLQKTVPDQNRGKVFSVLQMLNGPIAVLSIFIGTTGALYITAQNVLLIAALIEGVIAICVRLTRTFKEVDSEIYADVSL